jgi:hypothetical protein
MKPYQSFIKSEKKPLNSLAIRNPSKNVFLRMLGGPKSPIGLHLIMVSSIRENHISFIGKLLLLHDRCL